jgi:hypothetical protein
MAIGTTTAATLGAVSAGIGIATTAGTTAMSFAQAGKQNRLRRQAEADAAEAMAAARKKLDVNFYEQLAIQKEPYELEREAMLVQGAEALQAGVEGEQRGAAATAGRVQMAQQQGQRQIAAAMGQELMGLEKLTAAEESRLRDMGVDLDIRSAAGAQLAARDAREAAALATKQGMQGITNLGRQVAQALPLYAKTASARQFEGLKSDYEKAIKEGTLGGQFMGVSGQPLPFEQAMAKMGGFGINMSGVSSMKPMQLQDYLTQQSASKLRDIRGAGFQGINVNPYSINPYQIAGFEQGYGPQ